jgi:hypothetical protein
VVKLYFKEIIILETGIDISEKMVCNWNEIESVKTFIKSPIRVTRVMRGTEIICKITSLSPQYFEFIELLHKKTDPSVFDPVTTSVLSPAVRGSVIKYQKIFCLLYLASILILYIYEPVSRLMKHL